MNMSPSALSVNERNFVLSSSGLRHVERYFSSIPLMERAGAAAAKFAISLIHESNLPVLILAGPGNNGGDAFVVGRLLLEAQCSVVMLFMGEEGRLPHDAKTAYERYRAVGGAFASKLPEGDIKVSLVVDGLFGIGLSRAVEGKYASLIAEVNKLSIRCNCPVLALDCPSGLDADTGNMLGDAIRASHTITFIANKLGLLTGYGPDLCGDVVVDGLSLDTSQVPDLTKTQMGHVVTPGLFSSFLTPRALNSHKGTFGSAGVIGGAASMTGAAILASRAALRLGAGRVYVGLLAENAVGVDAFQPELMFREPASVFSAGVSALLCGPGMGDSCAALNVLKAAAELDHALVLDADALNILARQEDLKVMLIRRDRLFVMTPHPAEAGRLLQLSTAEVQSNRLASAQALARRYRAVVVLKGCGTAIAEPSGRWFVNTSGNPGLATAGSGDVLAGIVVALLAQGWDELEATLAAVHLHGQAADDLVAGGIGPIGLTAGELIDSARRALNRWVYGARC